jgi:hypothetical protein
MYDNDDKQAVLCTFWLINRHNTVFWSKVLYKICPKVFFEEYMILKIFVTEGCGFIPVQSFESHIHPQPPRLGLKGPLMNLPHLAVPDSISFVFF